MAITHCHPLDAIEYGEEDGRHIFVYPESKIKVSLVLNNIHSYSIYGFYKHTISELKKLAYLINRHSVYLFISTRTKGLDLKVPHKLQFATRGEKDISDKDYVK